MKDSKLKRNRSPSPGATTLISEDCKIGGDITGDCNLMVSGEVVGDCDISGSVTLAENGYWQGALRAADVTVAGQIAGDIVANGRVEIASTANITGTVTGDAIAVAEGAVVEGVMKTTDQSEPLQLADKDTG